MKLTYSIIIVLAFVFQSAIAAPLQDAIVSVSELSSSLGCPSSYVEEWNFPKAVISAQVFTTAASTISNNWQSITNEWPVIRDDYDKRVFFRNMAGFVGTNAFLGILGHVADDAVTNLVSRKAFIDMVSAPRTPLWMFVPDHYSDPAVSNLMLRVRPIFEGDGNATMFIDTVLSGEYKRYLDDARTGGAIEY